MDKKYCAAPWRGLHINPHGDVKTCCAGDPNVLGNLNHGRITEIMSSQALADIRSHLLQGVLHPQYCRNCIEQERRGYGVSERLWHNSVNADFNPDSPGPYAPSIIDVRWNITCNLSCNYCGPKCSSRWAGLMQIRHQSGTRAYYDQVCDFIAQHRDSIREVALVGGEPLLLTENSSLVSVLPPEAIVTVITNMSVDFDHNRVVEKLIERQHVGWSMSFDNVGQKFEYVRYGGDWTLLDQNVRRVADLRQTMNHYGGIHAVYNIYNCTRLCELRAYADSVNFEISWQSLFQPDILNPVLHAPWVRNLAITEIERYRAEFHQTDKDTDFFNRVLNEFHSIDPDWETIAARFREHTHLMEHKYHAGSLRFTELWPELADI